MIAANPRADLIRGLRELADFYDSHPDIELPPYPQFSHCVLAADDATGTARDQDVAQALDADVEVGAHVKAHRQFGAVRFDVYYVTRAAGRRHRAGATYLDQVEPDEDGAS
jgi:hypothetical protein